MALLAIQSFVTQIVLAANIAFYNLLPSPTLVDGKTIIWRNRNVSQKLIRKINKSIRGKVFEVMMKRIPVRTRTRFDYGTNANIYI